MSWSDVEEKFFQTLKRFLCEAPKLYAPDPKTPYTIQCDASSYVVGTCLSQRDEKENLHPNSFTSQSLLQSHNKLIDFRL